MSASAASDQEFSACDDLLPFATAFGVVPTHDACVMDTVEKIKDIRDGVLVLVDGDKAGSDYVKTLLKARRPPEHIVQWPTDCEMEDAVGWVLGNGQELAKAIQSEMPTAPASIPEIVAWLKKPTKEGGAKTDFLAYEAVASGILTSEQARSRSRNLLGAFVELTGAKRSSKLLQLDKGRSTIGTSVWRLVLEP